MIVTVTFVALAALAVIGAGGLIVCRRVLHAALSFLLCVTALAGLYLLLDLRFVAAIQLLASVGLTGAVLAISLPAFQGHSPVRGTLWYALAAVPLVALAFWCLARGDIGEPALTLPPVWAVRGSYLRALGREMVVGYLVPFLLLGVFLLTSMVTITYLLRQSHLSQRRGPGR